MNAPDKLAQFIRLTREPLPSSRKIYVPGRRADIQVPLREIMQSNGEAVTSCTSTFMRLARRLAKR